MEALGAIDADHFGFHVAYGVALRTRAVLAKDVVFGKLLLALGVAFNGFVEVEYPEALVEDRD